jgi:hypothetical protein
MSPKESKGKGDRELAAMGAVLRALDGLDGDSIQRVLDYVLGRLSLSAPPRKSFGVSPAVISSAEPSGEPHRQKSIRDLKEEKQPESSNQMAALVAYYLSELAPEKERRDVVEPSDLEKYFKQAGFKLTSALKNTLPNAASSGYFDLVGRGAYRLNPVGYNLVVHGLPRNEARLATPRPRGKKVKKSKKAAKR